MQRNTYVLFVALLVITVSATFLKVWAMTPGPSLPCDEVKQEFDQCYKTYKSCYDPAYKNLQICDTNNKDSPDDCMNKFFESISMCGDSLDACVNILKANCQDSCEQQKSILKGNLKSICNTLKFNKTIEKQFPEAWKRLMFYSGCK